MPIFRYERTMGDWVALAPERAARPHDVKAANAAAPKEQRDHDPRCPFCVGNEAETSATIDAELDPADPSRWLVRVFPNMYPVVTAGEAVAPSDTQRGLFHEIPGHGRHEVLVESPDHSRELAEQPLEQVERVLATLRRRARVLAAEPGIELVQIFKNQGSAAGSSLVHGHFQIVGMSVVPRQLRVKYQVAADYYNEHGVSVYTDLTRAELTAGVRVVGENAEFVAFAPFASRMPYETWIVPRTERSTFAALASEALPELARMLVDVLTRLSRALQDPPFNLVIFSAPRRHADEPDFVWHIEILPRLATPAGLELATGLAINPVLPEVAAQVLRKA